MVLSSENERHNGPLASRKLIAYIIRTAPQTGYGGFQR
jgi:hypothetical protein